MVTTAQRLITAEEFWQMPDSDKNRELVRGEVVKTMPTGAEHGEIAVALASMLRHWAKHGMGGYVGVEAGYILGRAPDVVRGADVSYVRHERFPPEGRPKAFWPIAPDLAVEIISPTETAKEVREKVRDYLSAGTPLVWTIYPDEREVVAHTPDGLARTYGENDTLEFPDVLPGFSCKVAELFT